MVHGQSTRGVFWFKVKVTVSRSPMSHGVAEQGVIAGAHAAVVGTDE